MPIPRNRKLWLVPLVGILGAGAFTGISQAVDGGGERPEVRSTSSTSTSSTSTSTSTSSTMAPATSTTAVTVEDISGPCDEAEHADDPRCTGVVAPTPTPAAGRVEDDGTDDVSGPCDEAEHANDPRCTGTAVDDDSSDDDDDDHSGPGHDGDDDHDDEDRSGHGGGDDD